MSPHRSWTWTRRFGPQVLIPLSLALAAAAVASVLLIDSRLAFSISPGATGNDQIHYLTCARNVAELGTYGSNLIYPAALAQEYSVNYFHMPGHCLVTAASLWLFGGGPLSAVLPSLVGLVLICLGLYAFALRCYSPKVAVLAVIFVFWQSRVLSYAPTAMSDLTTTAAAVCALAGIAHLPDRLRPQVGPLLLVLPFLFRETHAFLVVFVLALSLRLPGHVKVHLLRSVVILLATTVLLAVLLQLPPISGRFSIVRLHLFGVRTELVYADAVRLDLDPSLADWARAVISQFRFNLENYTVLGGLHTLTHRTGLVFHLLAVSSLAAIPFGLVKRDHVAVATGTFNVLTILAFFGLHYVNLRLLLLCVCLIGVPLSRALVDLAPRRLGFSIILVGAVAGAFALGIVPARRATQEASLLRNAGPDCSEHIGSLGHDGRKVLIMDIRLCLDFLTTHFPVKGAFVPANVETLRLLHRRFGVGTAILRRDHPLVDVLSPGFEAIGLKPREVRLDGAPHVVFQ